MYILDVAAYNSFVLYTIQNPEYLENDRLRKRRLSLEELSLSLINPLVENRMDYFSLQNFHGVKTHILESAKKTGYVIVRNHSPTASPIASPAVSPNSSPRKSRGRCKYSICLNKNKQAKICDKCQNFFCSDHCIVTTTINCTECSK
jgi:hypothetical protein